MRVFLQPLVLAVGVAALAGGAARAADVARPGPFLVAPQAYNWSGPYVGIQGGWDNNHADDVETLGPVTANGGILGVFGGVNMQLAGPWVVGIDGSINWTNGRGTDAGTGTLSFGPTWKGLIRGRLGVAFDRLLLYGTFGGAVAHFTETLNATSATPWGWTAGVGADLAVTDRMFLRVDWAYQNYGNFALNPGFTATNVTANTITAGLGFKF